MAVSTPPTASPSSSLQALPDTTCEPDASKAAGTLARAALARQAESAVAAIEAAVAAACNSGASNLPNAATPTSSATLSEPPRQRNPEVREPPKCSNEGCWTYPVVRTSFKPTPVADAACERSSAGGLPVATPVLRTGASSPRFTVPLRSVGHTSKANQSGTPRPLRPLVAHAVPQRLSPRSNAAEFAAEQDEPLTSSPRSWRNIGRTPKRSPADQRSRSASQKARTAITAEISATASRPRACPQARGMPMRSLMTEMSQPEEAGASASRSGRMSPRQSRRPEDTAHGADEAGRAVGVRRARANSPTSCASPSSAWAAVPPGVSHSRSPVARRRSIPNSATRSCTGVPANGRISADPAPAPDSPNEAARAKAALELQQMKHKVRLLTTGLMLLHRQIGVHEEKANPVLTAGASAGSTPLVNDIDNLPEDMPEADQEDAINRAAALCDSRVALSTDTSTMPSSLENLRQSRTKLQVALEAETKRLHVFEDSARSHDQNGTGAPLEATRSGNNNMAEHWGTMTNLTNLASLIDSRRSLVERRYSSRSPSRLSRSDISPICTSRSPPCTSQSPPHTSRSVTASCYQSLVAIPRTSEIVPVANCSGLSAEDSGRTGATNAPAATAPVPAQQTGPRLSSNWSYSECVLPNSPAPAGDNRFQRPVPKLADFVGLLCTAYRAQRDQADDPSIAGALERKISLLTLQARDFRMLKWDEERKCSTLEVQATMSWTGVRRGAVEAGEDTVNFTLQRELDVLDESDPTTLGEWRVTSVCSLGEAAMLELRRTRQLQGSQMIFDR